jgi:hypothetical protein
MYNDRMVAILAAFGLSRKSKLPVEGVAERLITYEDKPFTVWIAAVPPEGKKSRVTHRVIVRCGTCSQVFSAGRIRQHTCK